jgi:hypothetical protein
MIKNSVSDAMIPGVCRHYALPLLLLFGMLLEVGGFPPSRPGSEPAASRESGKRLQEAVSLPTALAIFDLLANREDLVFAYGRDGCYARAHLMCRAIIRMGLTPKKAWAIPDDGLRVQKPDGQTLEWWYHVAVTLPVRTADRAVQEMVFDPGLFDGPVSLAEWGDVMNASGQDLQIVPFGLPPKGYEGDYMLAAKTSSTTDQSAVETMLRYEKYQGATPRVVFRSQSRERFCQMQQILWPQAEPWLSGIESVIGTFKWRPGGLAAHVCIPQGSFRTARSRRRVS